jgi:hypothetical protein
VDTAAEGNVKAEDLARSLLPYLEAVANLHYLLDLHVDNPQRLKALRAIEEDTFEKMLSLVLSCLPDQPRSGDPNCEINS